MFNSVFVSWLHFVSCQNMRYVTVQRQPSQKRVNLFLEMHAVVGWLSTLKWKLLCRWFAGGWSWEQLFLGVKEVGLGRGKFQTAIQLQRRPQLILQGVLELNWLLEWFPFGERQLDLCIPKSTSTQRRTAACRSHNLGKGASIGRGQCLKGTQLCGISSQWAQ